MIVAEDTRRVRFVTQPDHAALAGGFADHWGNEQFQPLEPSPAVRIAAHIHDDGWWRRDRRPHLASDGTPEGFTDISPEDWIDLYDEGIEAAIELDRYAGLLVSMHGAGLRRRRYGLSPSWPRTGPAFAEFVERQESRQRSFAHELLESNARDSISNVDVTHLESLHETGTAPEETDSRLWHNYTLLQAWDTLSLSICDTLSPPKYAQIGPVPTAPAEHDETLTIEALGTDEFGVDPYPFDVEPLVAHVPTRTVPRASFDDEGGLVSAYYEADRETSTFSLRPVER